MDNDRLPEIGSTLGISSEHAEEAFVRAVRAKLRWELGESKLFQSLFNISLAWRIRLRQDPLTPPPFLGLLGICVLAASKMDHDPEQGISSLNYYARLNELLGINRTGRPSGFQEVTNFWDDLKNWLLEHNQGAFGLPTATPLRHEYIGYPISQCLLREIDRQKLPDFYRWQDLTPGDEFSGSEFLPRLRKWVTLTTCTLTNRGKELFHSKNKDLLQQAAEVVAADLKQWSGVSTDAFGRHMAAIDLRVDISRSGRQLACRLHPRAPERFPEGEYAFQNRTLYLKRLPGVSAFVSLPDELLAMAFTNGIRLERDGYQLYFNPTPIIPLSTQNDLGGWVACGRVRLGESHRILCRRKYIPKVETYLRRYATAGWKLVQNTQGLPGEWGCFLDVRIISAATDLGDEMLDCLVPRLDVSIHLAGGLKLDRNIWLQGGEPQAVVALPAGDQTPLSLDDQVIQRLSVGENIVDLAGMELPTGDHEIAIGERRRRFLTCRPGECDVGRENRETFGYTVVQDGFAFRPGALAPSRIATPAEQHSAGLYIVGARVIGLSQHTSLLTRKTVTPPHGYSYCVVIGRHPGEVIEVALRSWTSPPSQEKIIIPFEPQWMIKVGRKRQLFVSPVGRPQPPDAAEVAATERVSTWVHWLTQPNYKLKRRRKYLRIWQKYCDAARRML